MIYEVKNQYDYLQGIVDINNFAKGQSWWHNGRNNQWFSIPVIRLSRWDMTTNDLSKWPSVSSCRIRSIVSYCLQRTNVLIKLHLKIASQKKSFGKKTFFMLECHSILIEAKFLNVFFISIGLFYFIMDILSNWFYMYSLQPKIII